LIDDDPIYLFLAKTIFIDKNFRRTFKIFENGKSWRIEACLTAKILRNLLTSFFIGVEKPLKGEFFGGPVMEWLGGF